LILCGDSAGGNLAAAVSHAIRDSELHTNITIAGQVLIYPGLGGDISTGSYVTHANAPMLTTRDVEFYSTIRTGHKGINEEGLVHGYLRGRSSVDRARNSFARITEALRHIGSAAT